MHIRPADISDLDAVCDIATIVDPPHDGADLDTTYYRHLLQHGLVVVAGQSEIVVGYAAAIEVDGSQHVSDFFLHQDLRGHDIGRQLLEEVWKATGRSAPRQAFSSLDPAALAVYIRAGMRPRWPLLYLHGGSTGLPETHLRVTSADRDEAASCEAEWIGWDRRDEYTYWGQHPEAQIFIVRDGRGPVAVGCGVNSRVASTLGRLACVDPSVACEAVSAALRWIDDDDVVVSVPGTNPVLRMLLDARWRIVGQHLYCASEPALIDPQRLLPHPGLV